MKYIFIFSENESETAGTFCAPSSPPTSKLQTPNEAGFAPIKKKRGLLLCLAGRAVLITGRQSGTNLGAKQRPYDETRRGEAERIARSSFLPSVRGAQTHPPPPITREIPLPPPLSRSAPPDPAPPRSDPT